MPDQRSARRFATHQTATITVDGQAPIDCRVIDVSVNGAALWIGKHDVPDRFELKIRADDVRYESNVQWRRGAIIGVRLIAAQS